MTAVHLAVRLAQEFDAELVGSHAYAARLHDYRFKQMEFTLPEEYLVEAPTRVFSDFTGEEALADPRWAYEAWCDSSIKAVFEKIVGRPVLSPEDDLVLYFDVLYDALLKHLAEALFFFRQHF